MTKFRDSRDGPSFFGYQVIHSSYFCPGRNRRKRDAVKRAGGPQALSKLCSLSRMRRRIIFMICDFHESRLGDPHEWHSGSGIVPRMVWPGGLVAGHRCEPVAAASGLGRRSETLRAYQLSLSKLGSWEAPPIPPIGRAVAVFGRTEPPHSCCDWTSVARTLEVAGYL